MACYPDRTSDPAQPDDVPFDLYMLRELCARRLRVCGMHEPDGEVRNA